MKIADAQNITGVKTFDNGIIIPTGAGAELTGNASTATTLKTARTIAGVSFNGSQNISISATGLSDVTSAGSGAIITAAERTAISTNTSTITSNKSSLDTTIAAIDTRTSDLESDAVLTDVAQTIASIKTFSEKIVADAGIELGGNLHATVNYATAVTAGNYQNTDIASAGENPTVNVGDLVSVLNTLSNNIAALSTAVQALHGKKVLN